MNLWVDFVAYLNQHRRYTIDTKKSKHSNTYISNDRGFRFNKKHAIFAKNCAISTSRSTKQCLFLGINKQSDEWSQNCMHWFVIQQQNQHQQLVCLIICLFEPAGRYVPNWAHISRFAFFWKIPTIFGAQQLLLFSLFLSGLLLDLLGWTRPSKHNNGLMCIEQSCNHCCFLTSFKMSLFSWNKLSKPRWISNRFVFMSNKRMLAINKMFAAQWPLWAELLIYNYYCWCWLIFALCHFRSTVLFNSIAKLVILFIYKHV